MSTLRPSMPITMPVARLWAMVVASITLGATAGAAIGLAHYRINGAESRLEKVETLYERQSAAQAQIERDLAVLTSMLRHEVAPRLPGVSR